MVLARCPHREPYSGPVGPNPACSMWPHMEHGHEAGFSLGAHPNTSPNVNRNVSWVKYVGRASVPRS